MGTQGMLQCSKPGDAQHPWDRKRTIFICSINEDFPSAPSQRHQKQRQLPGLGCLELEQGRKAAGAHIRGVTVHPWVCRRSSCRDAVAGKGLLFQLQSWSTCGHFSVSVEKKSLSFASATGQRNLRCFVFHFKAA